MAISRQAYGLLAGLAAVVVVTLFFLTSKYSGKPGSLTGELEIDQPEPDIASLERLPAPVLSVERSPEDDHSGGTGGNTEKTPTVTIGMTDAGILLVADKASLQDVLDVLVGTTLVEFIDLRSASARLSEQAQDDKRSFRISGSLDDVLHVVMDQYNQSYVVSHSPRRGEQEIQVTKLFLHGASQDDNQLSGGSGYRSGASEGVATEWDVSESGGRHVSNAGRGGQEKVNISDVLRQRALSTSQRSAELPSGGTGQQSDAYAGGTVSTDAVSSSDRTSFKNTDPITSDYRDEETQARLAELTRKASQEVQALVEGLRAAEQNLKAQQNNQYGETEP